MTPSPLPDPLVHTRALIARYYFGCCAAVLLAGVVILLPGGAPAWPWMAAYGVLAAACLWLRRLRGPGLDWAIAGVALIGFAILTGVSAQAQWGLGNPALGFIGLGTCLVWALAGGRRGALVAAAGAASLLGLAAAEHAGWIVGAAAVADVPLVRRLFDGLLLVAAGLAAGWLLSRVTRHGLQASAERTSRFIGLLGVAADAYWETDAQFRVVELWRREPHGQFVAQPPPLKAWWELPAMRVDDESLEAHRADLESRRPFRDFLLRVRRPDGSVAHDLVSGEPRTDAGGVFLGYWCVSRDVTAEVRARATSAAAEGRYRELFTRIPTPLVLHRQGRVLDANPAAVAVFGYGSLGRMLRQDIVDIYEGEDDRQRERARFRALENTPLGDELPVDEFRIQALHGRRLLMRATGVQVAAEGGAATLSIYVDDTERRSAEEAVRRSEALLSHLVATSPDVITLSEMASGRYAMVNDTFTRLFGYEAVEVIGRTAIELGIWAESAARGRLVASLARAPTVGEMPAEFVGKNGERFTLIVSAARFMMDGQDYLVVNGRDVGRTERERLEREAILENASIGIALVRARRFHLANPCFEQMFGWPTGALAGQPAEAVWSDDAAFGRFILEVSPALGRGEPVETERAMRRFDGSTFLCRVQARAVDPADPGRGGTIWIAEDVTERRAVEQALAKARDDAEAASQAKSAFLANTSHEIRTPLNGLLGLARLARQPDVDEARRRQYLEQISDSAETLSAIISDILDLSKIEAGKLHLEAVGFDLQALLQALHRGYGTLADARGLDLQLALAPELPRRLRGDPVRVRQILGNFLSNALKFTARGGVELRAGPGADGAVRFEVRDSGPGIDPAVQARLFRPFTQADQSTTRRFGGTGLGLSICRELALLMGGQVGVDSAAGQGSVFWAELPLAPADDADVSGFGPLTGASSSPLADSRVLMVEDNPVNMLIAVALLEQWGVRVEQAGDGAQAIAAVARAAGDSRPFDVVLMDVQMPVMSGHEATRILREHHDAKSLPIIALTAAALVSEREQALAAGMNDFLTKPIDAQRLHEALVRVLGRDG